MPPPDAVIVSVRPPRFAEVLTLTVSVDEPEPPGMDDGLNDGVIPVLMPLIVSETGELKLPDGVTVTVN